MSNDELFGESEADRARQHQDQALVRDIIGNFETEVRESRNVRDTTLLEQQKKDDLKALQNAWIREKTVPDILPYEESLMERMLDRIRTQLEFIEMNSVELQTQEKDIKLMLVIVESELERIQFLVRSYVRLRLQKIDRYSLYIQSNASEHKKLNQDEITYMEGHLAMLYELFDEQFLKKMHTTTTNIGEDELMVDEPDLDRHVLFVTERESRARVDGDDFPLKRGEVYVMRYRSVAELLSRGDVVAI